MASDYPEIKQFHGLYLQRNSFTVPPGALEVANNVVISKDGVISSKRGSYSYFTPGAGTLNALFKYASRLLAVFNNKISYFTDTGSSPNETGTETTLSGTTVAVATVGRARAMEGGGNLYLSTDNGVIKLTNYNSIISKAGAPQGLDIILGFAQGVASTFLASGMTVAYRLVFGYTDANGNLVLGPPSDVMSITNTAIALSSASHVATAAAAVITVTSTAHGLATGMYMVFSGATVGTGSGSASNLTKFNGNAVITVTDANTFTYTAPGGAPGDGTYDTLNYCYGQAVRVESTIPSEVTSALTWFSQLYRTSQQASVYGDFQLIRQENLTAAQYTSLVFSYDDSIPEALLGAPLYTNENSGEGEAQANYRPPLCYDMANYKGYGIFANCVTRQLLNINLVDSTVLTNGDYIEFTVATPSTTRRYVATNGIANRTTRVAASSSSGLLLTSSGHGFSNGFYVYVSGAVGGTLASGFYYVVNVSGTTFKLSLTNGGAAIAYPATLTAVDIQAVTDGTYPVFYFDSTNPSPSVRLFYTAMHLVKAVNRDASSIIYANYISGINGVPGQMQFQSKGFVTTISARVNQASASAVFSPSPPISFASGNQVTSANSTLLNTFYASKLDENEAVPLVNFFPVGSASSRILRVKALRDSCIFVTQTGVYRMTGDNPSNFSITVLDSTVICVAADSVDVINNQVVFLSNQGVCLVTESSVEIISREIEDVIQPILGQSGLAAQTSGIAYETDRMYLLTTTQPNTTTASVTHAYNLLTSAWTTSDTLFTQAAIGPGDVLHYFNSTNDIKRERKKQTRIDFTGQNYSTTLTSVASDGLSGVLAVSGYTPAEGDILLKSDVITWITGATQISAGVFAITLYRSTNLASSDTPTLYSAFTRTVKLAPFHAGLLGRTKFFSQMMVHLRDDNLSRATIYFSNDYTSGSEITNWSTSGLTSSGWGNFPWGFQPWGQTAAINITTGTNPAPIIRVYIPSFGARGAYIQPSLVMKNAAEALNIQSISFVVRAYGERESR